MNKLELVEVGHTKKPKGIDGSLKIHIDDEYVDDVSNARAIFIDLDGSRVPFLINKFTVESQLLIKLDEVDSPQEAEQCTAKAVFLDVNEVTTVSDANAHVHPLVGYAVIDHEDKERGHITSVEEYPNQMMAFITNGATDFMLPIHEDIIIKLDEDNDTIKLEIPEGIEGL